MTKLLSPIRSLDVSSSLLEARFEALPAPIQTRLGFCKRELSKLRRKAREALKKHRIPSFSLGKLNKPVNQAKAEDFLPRLSEQLRLASNKAEQALIAYETSRDIHKLHEFRIQLKKYRYLLEIHSECGGRHVSELASLKALQDTLGNLHDLEVLRLLLSGKKMQKSSRHRDAQKDLQDFMGLLESELLSQEKSFLPRHRKLLKSLLSPEAAL